MNGLTDGFDETKKKMVRQMVITGRKSSRNNKRDEHFNKCDYILMSLISNISECN